MNNNCIRHVNELNDLINEIKHDRIIIRDKIIRLTNTFNDIILRLSTLNGSYNILIQIDYNSIYNILSESLRQNSRNYRIADMDTLSLIHSIGYIHDYESFFSIEYTDYIERTMSLILDIVEHVLSESTTLLSILPCNKYSPSINIIFESKQIIFKIVHRAKSITDSTKSFDDIIELMVNTLYNIIIFALDTSYAIIVFILSMFK